MTRLAIAESINVRTSKVNLSQLAGVDLSLNVTYNTDDVIDLTELDLIEIPKTLRGIRKRADNGCGCTDIMGPVVDPMPGFPMVLTAAEPQTCEGHAFCPDPSVEAKCAECPFNQDVADFIVPSL